MIIQKLESINFQGYPNLSIDLRGESLCINGENMSGKTTSARALCWGLSGTFPYPGVARITKSQVRPQRMSLYADSTHSRTGSEKARLKRLKAQRKNLPTIVKIDYTLASGEVFCVTRVQEETKKARLYLQQQGVGTVYTDDTAQELILVHANIASIGPLARRIEMLIRTMWFGVGQPLGFFESSDVQRKKITESLNPSHRLTKAHEQAKQTVSALTKNMDDLNSFLQAKRGYLEATIDEIRSAEMAPLSGAYDKLTAENLPLTLTGLTEISELVKTDFSGAAPDKKELEDLELQVRNCDQAQQSLVYIKEKKSEIDNLLNLPELLNKDAKHVLLGIAKELTKFKSELSEVIKLADRGTMQIAVDSSRLGQHLRRLERLESLYKDLSILKDENHQLFSEKSVEPLPASAVSGDSIDEDIESFGSDVAELRALILDLSKISNEVVEVQGKISVGSADLDEQRQKIIAPLISMLKRFGIDTPEHSKITELDSYLQKAQASVGELVGEVSALKLTLSHCHSERALKLDQIEECQTDKNGIDRLVQKIAHFGAIAGVSLDELAVSPESDSSRPRLGPVEVLLNEMAEHASSLDSLVSGEVKKKQTSAEQTVVQMEQGYFSELLEKIKTIETHEKSLNDQIESCRDRLRAIAEDVLLLNKDCSTKRKELAEIEADFGVESSSDGTSIDCRHCGSSLTKKQAESHIASLGIAIQGLVSEIEAKAKSQSQIASELSELEAKRLDQRSLLGDSVAAAQKYQSLKKQLTEMISTELGRGVLRQKELEARIEKLSSEISASEEKATKIDGLTLLEISKSLALIATVDVDSAVVSNIARACPSGVEDIVKQLQSALSETIKNKQSCSDELVLHDHLQSSLKKLSANKEVVRRQISTLIQSLYRHDGDIDWPAPEQLKRHLEFEIVSTDSAIGKIRESIAESFLHLGTSVTDSLQSAMETDEIDLSVLDASSLEGDVSEKLDELNNLYKKVEIMKLRLDRAQARVDSLKERSENVQALIVERTETIYPSLRGKDEAQLKGHRDSLVRNIDELRRKIEQYKKIDQFNSRLDKAIEVSREMVEASSQLFYADKKKKAYSIMSGLLSPNGQARTLAAQGFIVSAVELANGYLNQINLDVDISIGVDIEKEDGAEEAVARLYFEHNGERGEQILPSESQRKIIGLCLDLAMRHLGGGRGPVIIDEPESGLTDTNKAKLTNFLLSQSEQIIIVTNEKASSYSVSNLVSTEMLKSSGAELTEESFAIDKLESESTKLVDAS